MGANKQDPQPVAVPEGPFTVEVVTGVAGPSLYINDYRVAGNKPWGGGQALYTFRVSSEDLRAALAEYDGGAT